MTEIETKARARAGEVAGEYLDNIGKTDLGELTAEEFDIFLQAIIETYREAIAEQCQPE